MNAAERALSTFRQPPFMYNCAQTVCAAFGREDLIDQMKQCGGGRADEAGTCGALYAAMYLAGDKAGQVEAAFRKECGATRCRELKGGEPRVPCQTCVRTAASLVEGLQTEQA